MISGTMYQQPNRSHPHNLTLTPLQILNWHDHLLGEFVALFVSLSADMLYNIHQCILLYRKQNIDQLCFLLLIKYMFTCLKRWNFFPTSLKTYLANGCQFEEWKSDVEVPVRDGIRNTGVLRVKLEEDLFFGYTFQCIKVLITFRNTEKKLFDNFCKFAPTRERFFYFRREKNPSLKLLIRLLNLSVSKQRMIKESVTL